MKILLDTNVLLDAIASRDPFMDAAQKIILMAAEEKVEAYITANCLTDIYFIAIKYLPDSEVRNALRNIFDVFTVIDLTSDDCKQALDFPMADYEDAVAVVCAQKHAMDYIITRDNLFLSESLDNITILSPTEFINSQTE